MKPSAKPGLLVTSGSNGGGGGGASLSSIVNSVVKTYGAAIICLLFVCCAVLGSLSWNAFGALSSCDRSTHPSAAADLEWELARAEERFRVHMAAREERVKQLERQRDGTEVQAFEETLLFPVYPCVDPLRIGPWGEGGKWICLGHRRSPFDNPPVVLSVGSFGLTGFEDDVWRLFGAKTATFDPFLTAEQEEVVRAKSDHINFFPRGLTGRLKKPLGCDRVQRDRTKQWGHLDQLMWLANATYVDIFKIDCECCEYGFVVDLAASFSRDKQPLGQIQMELHWKEEWGKADVAAAVDLIRTLEALGYRLFHAEPNPYCTHCHEIAFIHESLVKAK